ncbi:unnamed protein product, partial [Staurois parvus]
GPPGNRGSWGPCVLAHSQSTPRKAYKRYQGYLMWPPTDPRSSGRVLPTGERPARWGALARGGLTTHGAPGQ